MKTQLEQIAVLTYLECCYAELAGSVASKLGKQQLCSLTEELRKMKLARAMLQRINKYYTLESDVTLATQVTITRPNTENVTITITVDATNYVYTGTDGIDTIISNFKTLFLGAGISFIQDSSNSFVFYSFDNIYSNPTVTCVLTPSTPTQQNEVVCVDYSEEIVDLLLDTYNCLTREEICGVIDEACCILETYCK